MYWQGCVCLYQGAILLNYFTNMIGATLDADHIQILILMVPPSVIYLVEYIYGVKHNIKVHKNGNQIVGE